MDNQIILTDSIRTIQQTLEIVTPKQLYPSLDIVCKLATIGIALANIILLLYIFIKNNNNDKINNEKNRKINLLKILILDYNMKYLYEFFENLTKQTDSLRKNDLSDDAKKAINDNILLLGIILRQKFIDSFLAIDLNLYESIINSTDKLIDSYTNAIFDEGIDLSHESKFNEVIYNPMIKTKAFIINLLFNYPGE